MRDDRSFAGIEPVGQESRGRTLWVHRNWFELRTRRLLDARRMGPTTIHASVRWIWKPFEGPPRAWTYAESARLVEALAAGLLQRGIRPGKRVMLHMDNCPEFVFVWLACAYIGARIRRLHQYSFLGRGHPLLRRARRDRGRHHATGLRPNAGGQPAQCQVAGDSESPKPTIRRCVNSSPSRQLSAARSTSAPSLIEYTSGTTARPKAVVWTHDARALRREGQGAARRTVDARRRAPGPPSAFPHQRPDVLIDGNPVGWRTAAPQPRFSASRFWDVAMRHRCTWSGMVPFCVKALVSQGPAPDHCFRLWGNGVSAVRAEDELLGVRTIGWYGMTETVTHCAVDDAALTPVTEAAWEELRPSTGFVSWMRRDVPLTRERRKCGGSGNAWSVAVRRLSPRRRGDRSVVSRPTVGS